MFREFNKSSSDDRPGPGICGSKYVEDAKAARSVRVWDRVPMKNIGLGGLRQVIRCRAGVGGQGSHCGDGKPVGPDRSLEKGVGGFKTLGTASQYNRYPPKGPQTKARLNKRTARRAIFPRNGGPRGKYDIPTGTTKEKAHTFV